MVAPSRDIELDPGPGGGERERMCVGTRTVRPVGDMIRFVIGPDGEAVPDLKRKLPGRGVWVTATHDALSDAVKRKALAPRFQPGGCPPPAPPPSTPPPSPPRTPDHPPPPPPPPHPPSPP